jgi:hypothetical protein
MNRSVAADLGRTGARASIGRADFGLFLCSKIHFCLRRSTRRGKHRDCSGLPGAFEVRRRPAGYGEMDDLRVSRSRRSLARRRTAIGAFHFDLKYSGRQSSPRQSVLARRGFDFTTGLLGIFLLACGHDFFAVLGMRGQNTMISHGILSRHRH